MVSVINVHPTQGADSGMRQSPRRLFSVQTHLGPEHHLHMGHALHPLVKEDTLIIASGSFTHDLSNWRGRQGMTEPDWVAEFAEWFDGANHWTELP